MTSTGNDQAAEVVEQDDDPNGTVTMVHPVWPKDRVEVPKYAVSFREEWGYHVVDDSDDEVDDAPEVEAVAEVAPIAGPRPARQKASEAATGPSSDGGDQAVTPAG